MFESYRASIGLPKRRPADSGAVRGPRTPRGGERRGWHVAACIFAILCSEAARGENGLIRLDDSQGKPADVIPNERHEVADYPAVISDDPISFDDWQWKGIDAALSDPHEEVKYFAINYLATYSGPNHDRISPPNEETADAIALKLAATLRSDSGPRAETLLAIASLGPGGAGVAPQVVQLIRDKRSNNRVNAVKALIRMGPSASSIATELADALQSEDDDAVLASEEVITKFGAIALIREPRLRSLLRMELRKSAPVAKGAIEAIGSFGKRGSSFAASIISMFDSRDYQIRDAAVAAFASIGEADSAVVSLLKPRLRSGEPLYSRQSAAESARRLGAAAAPLADSLARLLTDSDYQTRRSAAAALGALDTSQLPSLVPSVLKVLTEGNEDARNAAVDVIEAMYDRDSQMQLAVQKILQQSNPEIQLAALTALQGVGPEARDAAASVSRFLASADVRLVVQAVRTLEAMGAMEYVPQLAELMDRPDLFAAIISALPSFGARHGQMRRQIDVARDVTAMWGGLQRPWIPATTPIALTKFGSPINANPDRFSSTELVNRMIKHGHSEDWRAYFDQLVVRKRIDLAETLSIIDAGYKDTTHLSEYIFLSYITASTSDVRDLVLRLSFDPYANSSPNTDICDTHGESEMALLAKAFIQAKQFRNLRRSVADNVATCADRLSPIASDTKSLKDLADALKDGGFGPQALVLEKKAELGRRMNWLIPLGDLFAAQMLLWVAFIAWYPKSPWVQSLFFWNKWVRRSFGFPFVGFLLTHVPFLRRRLLAPFRQSLLPKRDLSQLNPDAYYESMKVIEDRPHQHRTTVPVADILYPTRGQVVIEAPSGAGKTMVLLKLALATEKPAVLLCATECDRGVLEAIQFRLQGQARDASFLNSIIHAGGLDVYIDGLNECSPVARAQIASFVTQQSRGNIVMTTQPIDWKLPRTVRLYRLQPLKDIEIEQFLLSQWAEVCRETGSTEDEYRQRVKQYLAVVPDDEGSNSTPSPLGNPMDAAIAAHLLAQGSTPDPLRLIAQQFERVSDRLRQEKRREFQRQRFAERVYEWHASGAPDMDVSGFEVDVAYLSEGRLMLQRTEVEIHADGPRESTRWVFRHEKIMFYFMLPAFLGHRRKTRREKHIRDQRFFGIFELLAVELGNTDEHQLYKAINAYAANTNENELRNRYERARRQRHDVSETQLISTFQGSN